MLARMILYLSFLTLCSCRSGSRNSLNVDAGVPSWAKDAIWYQIFPERFRNGDTTNDPKPESLLGSWPFVKKEDYKLLPTDWIVTPWGQDWYRKDPYFNSYPDTGFYYGIQTRRYGGDLKGVMDKLDYLQDLGITAIYFNPLNDSPSLHKYDAAIYRHIDRHFGPDPNGDTAIIEQEIPDDPSTWKWTSADLLFLDLIKNCHDRGIKVVIDYSWNHTGINFWAFRDLMEKGQDSKYVDWYYVREFDDPETTENEFDYKAWFGAETLPELKEIIEGPYHEAEPLGMLQGNFYSQTLKDHIFHVTRRWLDPDGDGDSSDGLDGFRLDVAAEVPIGFWKEYRTFVKSINPEAYLIGEIWWEDWPDKLLDPKPFLDDAFDAVMNYRWYREARRLFAQVGEKTTPSIFVKRIDSLNYGISNHQLKVLMNVAATHDTPRLATSLFNKNRYKFNSGPRGNNYMVQKPDALTREVQKMFLVHQFTFPGAPHLYYGDEVGMWGADDPDCRKPMVWDDLKYEDEELHPLLGKYDRKYPVKVDRELHHFYKTLITLRKTRPVLVDGDLEFTIIDDNHMILAYERKLENDLAISVFNISDQQQTIFYSGIPSTEYINPLTNENFKASQRSLSIQIPPRSAIILLNK